MRIGFDISQTGTAKAGCGFVADSLLTALLDSSAADEQFVVYPTFGTTYFDPEGPDATRQVVHPQVQRASAQATPAAAEEFWTEVGGEPLEARIGFPDVIHGHNFYCPDRLQTARFVYTLHDLSFLHHPEWTTERNRQICFDGVFAAALRADAVVAVSEATRTDWLETFPHYPAERTRVMPLASRFRGDEQGRRPRAVPGRARAYWLVVATLEPRKNPIRALHAYARYAQAVSDPYPLVWAGGDGWLTESFEAELRTADLGAGRVIRTGYVDEDELVWLYRNAFGFLYPSLFEGFGLPIVEAMSFGAAVITGTTTSLPEVAGDAASLIDVTDSEALGAELVRWHRSPEVPARRRELALEQARRFDWRISARVAREVYREVLGRPRWREQRVGSR